LGDEASSQTVVIGSIGGHVVTAPAQHLGTLLRLSASGPEWIPAPELSV